MKLVALDLDGTLLERNGTVPQETIQQMTKLHASGVAFAIATGRSFDVIDELLLQKGVFWGRPFPDVIMADERDVYFLDAGRYVPWTAWNDQARQRELQHLALAKAMAEQASHELKTWFLVNNAYLQDTRGYVEIFFRSAESAAEFHDWFAAFLDGSPLRPVRNNRLIALRAEHTGKGRVLERIADHLGLGYSDVLAMGDSHNDHDMLNRRFHAATTANADLETKALVEARGGVVSSKSRSAGVADVLANLTLSRNSRGKEANC